MVNCRGCGKPIKFDTNRRSQSGKQIPLEMDGDAHQCPASPYNQNRQVQVQQPPPQQQQQQQPAAVTNTQSQRAETMWLIPKEDWDGLKKSFEYVSDNIVTIQKQIDQLTQYYSTLVEMLNNNRKDNNRPPKWEQDLIEREERFDRDRENPDDES